MTLKIDAKFEEKLICCFKTDKNLVNFYPSTQKSQKVTLWSVLCLKGDAKFEEKLTCGLENNMRNLTNLYQSTWNWDSKLGLLWSTFNPSRKCMSLKFTGELCVMTMNKDTKFEKELTSSKLTWGI